MKVFALLLPLLMASSCATPTALKTVELKELPQTTLNLDFELEMTDPVAREYGCQLVFRNVDRDQRFSVQFPRSAASGHLAVQAVAGRHLLERIFCHSNLQYEIRSSGDRYLQVHSGKVNYVGWVTMKQYEDNSLTVRVDGPARLYTDLFMEKLQPRDRKRAVSAHSGRPLRF